MADTSGGLDPSLLAFAPLCSVVSLLLLYWDDCLALLCSFTDRRPGLSSGSRDNTAATLSRTSELASWWVQELGLPQNTYLVPGEHFPHTWVQAYVVQQHISIGGHALPLIQPG